MAKKVRLKERGGILNVIGIGQIHDGNLTWEKYAFLCEHNPNLKVNFVEEEETKVEKKSKDGKEIQPSS